MAVPVWAKLLILAFIAGDVSFVRSQSSQQGDGGGEYEFNPQIYLMVVLTSINFYMFKCRPSSTDVLSLPRFPFVRGEVLSQLLHRLI